MINDAIKRMLQAYQTRSRADAERALREILQELTLVGLWRGKFFEHAAFYGGTALRILYGLDRFSEDLDFTLLDPKKSFTWNKFAKDVTEELQSYGFEVTFEEKKKSFATDVQSAFLKTNTLHALLKIGVTDMLNSGVHPDALIRIKVEIDSDPTQGYDVESVYLREPMPVSIRALKESSLFAGKINAALFRAWKGRVKGRDWYDLIWFLRRGVAVNSHYLYARMCASGEIKNTETLTEEKVKSFLKKRLETINLEAAKDDVKPFLRDLAHIDLWSKDFFNHWINQLKFE